LRVPISLTSPRGHVNLNRTKISLLLKVPLHRGYMIENAIVDFSRKSQLAQNQTPFYLKADVVWHTKRMSYPCSITQWVFAIEAIITGIVQ
jgi:hypothetical protein